MHFVGGLLGNAVYNLYFYVTFLVFRIHWNEACSHITHEDHRSFLRMRVTPQGDLDIYVVGVEKVPERWIAGQHFEPESPLAPHLVEHIHIPAAAAVSACELSSLGEMLMDDAHSRKKHHLSHWGGLRAKPQRRACTVAHFGRCGHILRP